MIDLVGAKQVPERVDENPILGLRQVAVTLHFYESESAPIDPKCQGAHCGSMELDLLANPFRSQRDRPFITESYPDLTCDLELEFPAEIEYHTETRDMVSVSGRPRFRARAIISSTLFTSSGLRLWHLTLRPAANGVFTEYDLIKLIHLYDGLSERTELTDKAAFHWKRGDATGTEHNPSDLMVALLQDNEEDRTLALKAGTIQVVGTIPDPERTDPCAAKVAELLMQVGEADESNDPAFSDKLRGWMAREDDQPPESEEGRYLLALCGIVSGIFDFTAMDEGEISDTLKHTFLDSSSLMRIDRRTMLAAYSEDRAFGEYEHTIGISPYVVLPHSVLLHNECMLEQVEEFNRNVEERRAGVDKRASLRAKIARWLRTYILRAPAVPLHELESVLAAMHRRLKRCYLPNLFHYATERALYDDGQVARGLPQKRAYMQDLADELETDVELKWNDRREKSQLRIQELLFAVAVFPLAAAVAAIIGRFGVSVSPKAESIVAFALVAIVVVSMEAFGGMGRRRKTGN